MGKLEIEENEIPGDSSFHSQNRIFGFRQRELRGTWRALLCFHHRRWRRSR